MDNPMNVATQSADDERDWYAFARKQIADGHAVQSIVMSWRGLKQRMQENVPGAEVWYTERNGDLIVCLVPAGTPPENLPKWALDYMAIEWIDPDKDFGTGVFPKHDFKPKPPRASAL